MENSDFVLYKSLCCHAELDLITRTPECNSELKCSKCGHLYPIVNLIPRFVSSDNYAHSFGYQWNIHSKTQLDSFTGLNISRDRLKAGSMWPDNLKGQLILEAGSGAGRFTEVLLSTGADVYSFDYSSAVEANLLNNGHNKKLHLFQADIYNLPFLQSSFDKVICFGVIQHTPDPSRTFASLAKQVRPGGELVIDVYRKDIWASLQWKYLLRPYTRKLNKKKLYNLIAKMVTLLLPAARVLRKIAGRAGARIVPIVEYSHLGLSSAINKDWAILDTFDMYSPEYDLPQTLDTVKEWFERAGFIDINVQNGFNGVVGKGRKI